MALYQSGSGLGALVGVGTTNPTSNLQVYGTPIAAGNVFSVLNTAASGNVAQFSSSAGTALIINSIGNVGIGTTNPTSNLQVVGNVLSGNVISSVAMYGVLAGANTVAASTVTATSLIGTYYGAIAGSNTVSSSNVLVASGLPASIIQGSNVFVFSNAYGFANVMVMNSIGNVGIGKTNPGTALDVNGTVTATTFSGSAASLTSFPTLNQNTTGSAGSLSTTYGTGQILYGQASGVPASTSTFVYSGGNVGIGSASPRCTLDVVGSGITEGIYAKRFFLATPGDNTDSSGNLNDGGPWYGLGYSVDTGLTSYIQLASYYGLALKTGGSPILMIGGNVGIGKTNPGTFLDVNGTVTATTFSGAGTSLTGTAASLTAGNATTAVNQSGGTVSCTSAYSSGYFGTNMVPGVATRSTGGFYVYGDGNFNIEMMQRTSGVYGLNFITRNPDGVFSWRKTSSASDWGTELMFLNNAGNLGIGTTSPVTRLDVWTGSARSGTAPASYGSIYATADSTSANSGSIPIAEFRHSNQAQGIAICYDGLYASGYNPSQPIFLRAKSAAEVQVPGTGVGGSGYGNLLVDYPNSTSAGGAITIRNSAGGTGAFSSLLFETDGSTACTTTSGAPISFNQANGMLYCQNVGSAYGGGNAGKMGLQLWSGSVEFESQTWLPNGFVGIGTTSPNQTLEIGCNNATGQNPLRLSNYNTGVNNTKYIGMEFRGTDSVGTLKDCGQIRVNPLNQDWSNGASMSLLVRSGDTVSTERMTILGTGCVGINQTSPTFLLDISGNGITNNHMQLATTNGNLGAFATTLRMAATGTVGIWGSICYYQTIYTANSLFGGNGYGQIQANQYNDTSGGYFNINTNGTGGFALNGYGNGTLSITSGRVYNSSDGRMKSNINYISETSTPKIMGLKPATFSFTTDHNNTLKMGFIAQDLEQYIPIAVDGKKYQYMWKTKMAESGETVPDLDENGNYQYTDEIRPRSVDNMAIIATLVKAFQEQVQVIEDLKQRIQILESTA